VETVDRAVVIFVVVVVRLLVALVLETERMVYQAQSGVLLGQ
jgi:hypothetical protein